jgi:dihydroneopterin aldolase
MIDELARAYERTSADVSDPLDRISVRDYVREVEIGAFRSERGVTQRIRFNVVLEVSRHAASVSDDVDQVISYDMIVEAIDDILSTGRINLLETCAERVAEKCLIDPRAVRALVRIEKLDRIPGALGVEILRNRLPESVRKVSPVAAETGRKIGREARGATPAVLVLPSDALDGQESGGWRRALADYAGPIVALAAPGALLDAAKERAAALRLGPEESRRLALLAYEQAAWAFSGAEQDLVVVETRTELHHAMKIGASVIWAPFKVTNETAVEADLAEVLATLIDEIAAGTLINTGESPIDIAEPGDLRVLSASTPDQLRALGAE